LILDLDELARTPWSSLEHYADVRGIPTLAAARRSLFRLKALLAKRGVALEVQQENHTITAHFGTRAIRELIEVDLVAACALLERLDAQEEGPAQSRDMFDQALLSPETIAVEYRHRLKSCGWIARTHGIGRARIRRLLAATGPVPDRVLRLCVEERKPKHVVDLAMEAAGRGARLEEIASILECSERTARRFMKRHELVVPRGRPRTSGRPRAWSV